jgi:lipoate---protein ligase
MNNVRVIDLGDTTGLRSVAAYHAVGEHATTGQPDTMLLTVPRDRYVSLGAFQQLKGTVDTDYCRENGIPVYRRNLGGRAVMADSGQQLFQIVSCARRSHRSVARVYHDILRVVIETYRSIEVDAHYMPVSDVYVRNHRIGGSAIGCLGDCIVVASGLVLDMDRKAASSALSASENGYVSIASETGKVVDRARVLACFLETYERLMNAKLEHSELTEAEAASLAEAEERLSAGEWLNSVDRRIAALKDNAGADGKHGEAVTHAAAGPIHATVCVKHGVIEDVVLSGDFFFYEDHLRGLEQAFRGASNDWGELMTVVMNYCLAHEIDCPGVDPADWVSAVSTAFVNAGG